MCEKVPETENEKEEYRTLCKRETKTISKEQDLVFTPLVKEVRKA
jgi:hypothetical protein